MPAAMTARLRECIEDAEHPDRVRVLGTLWVAVAAASARFDFKELLARAVAFGFWHLAFIIVVLTRAIVAFVDAIQ